MAKQPLSDVLNEVLHRIEASTGDIRNEMSEMRKDLSAMAVLTSKQQGILETHIRRTEAAEAAIKQTAATAAENRHQLEGRIVPLESHVAMWAGAGKLVAMLALLAGMVMAIYKLLG